MAVQEKGSSNTCTDINCTMNLLSVALLFTLCRRCLTSGLSLVQSPLIPNLPLAEYDALFELYNSTNGADWMWIEPSNATTGYPWNFSSPDANPCADNWQGITCTTANNESHVYLIDLYQTNLVGALPASIGVFSCLTSLQLNENFISGTVPDAIGHLSSLQYVNFEHNPLTGTLPESIGNISGLMGIGVSSSHMYGTIPLSFQNLILLEILILGDSHFSGTLPEAVFSNLTHLSVCDLVGNSFHGTIPAVLLNGANISTLDLGTNFLTGTIPPIYNNHSALVLLHLNNNNLNGTVPHSIGNATLLQYLYLSVNQLTGPIPNTILNLSSLSYLGLENNTMSGSIPPTLATSCTLLSFVFLDYNAFTGHIPESLWVSPELVYLVVNSNKLSGTIPDSIGNLSSLQYMSLEDNPLSGTLPESIGNVTGLIAFGVSNSHMYGTIPHTFKNLVQLEVVVFADSYFSGTLPDAVFNNLTHLSVCDLVGNSFHGTIPAVLLNVATMQNLYMGLNFFTGTIPPIYTMNSTLVLLHLNNNNLNGTVPHSIGNATMLQILYLSYNHLSSTIPSTILNLSSLSYLGLANNTLSGSIPPALATSCTLLTTVYLDYNTLTGRIPEAMWALPELVYLVVNNNKLTGTIPGSIGNATKLYELILESNAFHGTLPDTIGSCAALYYVELASNLFTGTLPSSLGQLTNLQVVDVGSNRFTGSIPASLNFMPVLDALLLDSNLLTGTLPIVSGGWRGMITLNMSNNMLSGTIPRAISQLPIINALSVSDNKFTGTLDNMLNVSVQTNLAVLSVENNQFSGPLPRDLFLLPLEVLTAVGNCFAGTLPDTVCGCTTLNTLALDGLSSAPSCGTKLLSFSDAYIIRDAVKGTIPSCLFTLPVLTILHLSGNGFTGTLPNSLPNSVSDPIKQTTQIHPLALLTTGGEINPTYQTQQTELPASGEINQYLVDLSLSHNRLTGTVPLMFQRKQWFNFDLSYNRLSGTLSAEFANQNLSSTFFDELSTILKRNISPDSFTDGAVSLENNRISGRIPPVLQDKRDISILGTNMFSCNTEATNLPRYDSGLNTYECGSDSFNFPYYFWLGSVVVCMVCIVTMLYIVRRNDAKLPNSAWAAVLHDPKVTGPAPTLEKVLHLSDQLNRVALYSTVYVLVVLAPVYIVLSLYYGTVVHQYAWIISAAFVSGYTPFIVVLVLLVVLLIGMLVCYIRNIPDGRVVPAPHIMSRWRRFAVYTAFIFFNFAIVGGANTAYVYIVINYNRRVLLAAQFMLSCFKLLWNRFFSIYAIRFVAAYNLDVVERVDQSYMYTTYTSLQVFVALVNNIAIPCFVVAVVSPNCFYNVFVASPAVDTRFVYHACSAVVNGACTAYTDEEERLLYKPPFAYSYQCSSSIVTSYAPAFVILCILRTFVTPALQYLLFVYCKSAQDTWLRRALASVMQPILKPIPATGAASTVYQPYFDANQLLLSLVTYLGVLLTFGAVFPPLALALLLTMYSVLFTNRVKLGRFLTNALEAGVTDVICTIETECNSSGIDTIRKRSAWMLITASCWFYTLFLFDTLGDVVGFEGAYWVLIVVPLMPVVIYGCSCGVSWLVASVVVVGNENGNESAQHEDRPSQILEMTSSVDSRSVDTVNILHRERVSAV